MQKLTSYSELEAQQSALLNQMRKVDLESISCTNCGSRFFEQVDVCKYKADHTVILGQEVPPKKGSMPYKMLRCIHCQNLLEPRVLHNTRDGLGGDYSELLDTLEGKLDSRKKSDAVPTQKL